MGVKVPAELPPGQDDTPHPISQDLGQREVCGPAGVNVGGHSEVLGIGDVPVFAAGHREEALRQLHAVRAVATCHCARNFLPMCSEGQIHFAKPLRRCRISHLTLYCELAFLAAGAVQPIKGSIFGAFYTVRRLPTFVAADRCACIAHRPYFRARVRGHQSRPVLSKAFGAGLGATGSFARQRGLLRHLEPVLRALRNAELCVGLRWDGVAHNWAAARRCQGARVKVDVTVLLAGA
mmetsp:Transcript_13098/g.30717  ORF Transcript_13098/g.30717 Transcript_13098/m.30717 type:complete len:236 (-) Transcript_13098:2268-2975(-)